MLVSHYSAWVYVDYPGSRLEFVLARAEERNGKSPGYYSDKLWNMLKAEFEGKPTIGVLEKQIYGDVSFCVSADSIEELTEAIDRCKIVTQVWKSRYNILNMKD